VPFFLPRKKYVYTNEFLPVVEKFKVATGKQVINEWVTSDDPVTKIETATGTVGDYIPTKTIAIPVNKANALASGIVKAEDADLMVDTLYLTLNRTIITRDQLMLIDLLANFDWKRPIYFTQPYSPAELGLQEYLQLDGFAYRLVPIKTVREEGDYLNIGRIDTEYLYDKLMNQFHYGNIADPKVYADYTVHTNFYSTQARTLYARLALALMAEGDTTRAIAVLDKGVELIPFRQIRHAYIATIPIIQAYYMAGEDAKGDAILKDYAQNLEEYVTYYLRFTGTVKNLTQQQLHEKIQYLYELQQVAQTYGRTEIASAIEKFFKTQGIQ
ncbi:MAG: DUF2723 domain-containing protein, partial [Alistipes sp.]|nr:DUF2723 domain-containing protein [Alistipes sp.]